MVAQQLCGYVLHVLRCVAHVDGGDCSSKLERGTPNGWLVDGTSVELRLIVTTKCVGECEYDYNST